MIIPNAFFTAMNDDFGTVEAIAVLFELANEVNKTNDALLAGCLKTLANIIGLLERDPMVFFHNTPTDADQQLSNEEIDALIKQRQEARIQKKWAESDRIRDFLIKNHIILEDGAGVTTWRRG